MDNKYFSVTPAQKEQATKVTPIEGIKYRKGYSPYVGEDGYWYEYNDLEKTFESTGVLAEAKDGYTPQKGIDYYTPTEVQQIKDEITPRKGVDYFDGDSVVYFGTEPPTDPNKMLWIDPTEEDELSILTKELEDRVDTKTAQAAADLNARADSGEFDGISPIVSLNKVGTSNRLIITDRDGMHFASIEDGKDGNDGVTPIVSTLRSGNTTTVRFQTGTKIVSAQIKDGEKGDPGEITYVENPYDDTEIKRELTETKQDLSKLKTKVEELENSGVDLVARGEISQLSESMVEISDDVSGSNNGYEFIDSKFINGSLESGQINKNVKYRVSTVDILKFNEPKELYIADGFRVAPHRFENGVFKQDMGWKTGTFLCDGDYRFTIGRSADDTSEVASVSEFRTKAILKTNLLSEIEGIKSVVPEIDKKVNKPSEYHNVPIIENAGYYNNGVITQDANWRHSVVNVSQFDVLKVSCAGNYYVRAYYFVDENGTVIEKSTETTNTKYENLSITVPVNASKLYLNRNLNPLWSVALLSLEKLVYVDVDWDDIGSNKGIKTRPHPTYISHAGSSRYYAENTLPAFLGASRYGYEYVEFDLRITSDGHFVLMHDETVDRTTDGVGKVSDKTLAQIKGMNIDLYPSTHNIGGVYDGLKVPTIEEALSACVDLNLRPMMETRNFSAEQLSNLVSIIDSYNLLNDCVIESFYISDITSIRNINKDINVGLLVDTGVSVTETLIKQIAELNASMFLNYTMITDSIRALCKQYGVQMGAWTVNGTGDEKALVNKGVSFLVTERLINHNCFNGSYISSHRTVEDGNTEVNLYDIDNVGYKVVRMRGLIRYTSDKPTLYICGTNVILRDGTNEWIPFDEYVIALDGVIRLRGSDFEYKNVTITSIAVN